MAFVSVIIPLYNCERYIAECVESVVCQSFKDIELIIINNGSTDNSLEICEGFARRFDNIHIFTQSNSGECNRPRKAGLEKATGEWVMMVDADDVLDKDAIRYLLNESSGCDLVSGSFEFIDKDGNYLCPAPKNECVGLGSGDKLVSDLLTRKRNQCVWRQLIRKKCIDLSIFDTEPEIKKGEDILVMLGIAIQIKTYRHISKVIYSYRWYENNTSHRKVDMIDISKRIANKVIEIFSSKSIVKKFSNQINSQLIEYYLVCSAESGINKTPMASFMRSHITKIKYLTKRQRLYLVMLFVPSKLIREKIRSLLFGNTYNLC